VTSSQVSGEAEKNMKSHNIISLFVINSQSVYWFRRFQFSKSQNLLS